MEEIGLDELAEMTPYTGEPRQQAENGFDPKAIVGSGKTLMRSEAGYHTAVYVQKERDLDAVVEAVEREAMFAGDAFYYSWKVKDERTGRSTLVEGGTIGMAQAIARIWGNCAVTMEIEERGNSWVFTPCFVDLETGFTMTRTFRKTIPKRAPGKYDVDRWSDMQYQVAQSKAIRNVIFNGTPAWLKLRALAVAKQAANKQITKDGIDESRRKVVEWLGGHGITKAQIVQYLGKPLNECVVEDIRILRNVAHQIHVGDVHPSEVFPPIDEPKTPPAKPPQTPSEEAPPKGQPAPQNGESRFKTLRTTGVTNVLKEAVEANWEGWTDNDKAELLAKATKLGIPVPEPPAAKAGPGWLDITAAKAEIIDKLKKDGVTWPDFVLFLKEVRNTDIQGDEGLAAGMLADMSNMDSDSWYDLVEEIKRFIADLAVN